MKLWFWILMLQLCTTGHSSECFVQVVENRLFDTTQESVSLRPGLEIRERGDESNRENDWSQDIGLVIYVRPKSERKMECVLSVDLDKIYQKAKERSEPFPFSGPGKWRVYTLRTGASTTHFLVHKEDSGIHVRMCPAQEVGDGVFIASFAMESTSDKQLLDAIK